MIDSQRIALLEELVENTFDEGFSKGWAACSLDLDQTAADKWEDSAAAEELAKLVSK